MRLYIDFQSPASCLAMAPTLALVQRCGVRIEYLPFKTSQQPVPRRRDDETVGESHRRTRAASRRDIHLKYAAIQGTPMVFPQTFAQTDLALAALLYVRDEPLAFIQAAFNAYWQHHRDLNDAAVVRQLLREHGYDEAAFDREHWLGELDRCLAEATEANVIDAPCYLIEEQLFIGREHLPWIEALLCGNSPHSKLSQRR